MIFLTISLLISLTITAGGSTLAFLKPKVYNDYFPIFHGIVMSIFIGFNFWGAALFTADSILVSHLDFDTYIEISKHLRKITSYSYLYASLTVIQLFILHLLYMRPKK